MQILFAAATNAATSVAFPYLELDHCRNHPIVVDWARGGPRKLEKLVNDFEFELEDLATVGCFLPNVDQVKQSVVRPNACAYLFKNFHFLSFCPTGFKASDGIGK